MNAFIFAICFFTLAVQSSSAQPTETIKSATSNTPAQQEMINLSKTKWNWMADRNVASWKMGSLTFSQILRPVKMK